MQVRRPFVQAIVTAVLIALAVPAMPGADAAPRTPEAVEADVSAAYNQPIVHRVADHTTQLADPAFRAKVAPEAVPAFEKLLHLADELAAFPAGKSDALELRSEALPILIALQDPDAVGYLAHLQSTGEDGTAAAQTALIVANWWTHAGDAAAQGPILDRAASLAEKAPGNATLAESLLMMATEGGAANADLRDRALGILTSMHGDDVDRTVKMATEVRKLYALEGQPLQIEGAKFGGGAFDSADWKGKVVVVDFWATWCGPCRRALPELQAAYKELHDQGLEVVGVSCDHSGEALARFLKKNDMPWPQLFDESTAGWHPIAKSHGVIFIPTTVVIDRNGIVRSINPDKPLEDVVKPLLAEKAAG